MQTMKKYTEQNIKITLFFMEVELIYSVVLVSGVQQSDSVIHVCTYSFSYSLPL